MTEAFTDICKGDKQAYDFCNALYQFLHLYDDLYDRDQERTPDDVSFALLNLLHTASEPFFVTFKPDLLPVLFASAQAWAASVRLAGETDIQKKLASEVLKSQYQDVFFRVAFLVGGSDHAVAMDKKYRSYKFG